MAPTDPEHDHQDFEPRSSSTPKRKPLMISTPRSEGGDKPPLSDSKQSSSWPYHHEYHRAEHPGAPFSPTFQDRSMQPPPHRTAADHTQQHEHNSSSQPEEKRSQSIHRTTSGDYPNPPESMEEDDDMGATDYLSLPVGSFAEDSPPRRRTPTKPDDKVKRSPHYPFGGGYPNHLPPPPPPPPHYHHHAPPYPYPPYPPHRYYPPHGYPPPPHGGDPWTSPQAYDAPPEYPPKDGAANDNNHNHDDNNVIDDIPKSPDKSNIKDAFRSSPLGASPGQPSPPPAPIDGPISNSTPEKAKLSRSPFRSPPLSQTKRSPFHGSTTPLGRLGSFGMLDTPGGTLAAEFSPMGPVLKSPFALGEHPTPPQLSLSRSHSEEDLARVVEDDADDSKMATSPFSGFLKNFSDTTLPPKTSTAASASVGGLQGVTRSPLMSERRLAQVTASDRSDRPTGTQSLASSKHNNRPRDGATKIMASPMGQASGATPRQLWKGTSSDSGPMRLELGGSSSLKKSFDGINSMMRAGSLPMATPSTAGRPPYHGHYHPPPSYAASYRKLNTPIKLEPSPGPKAPAPAMVGNKRAVPAATASATLKSAREGKIPRTGGKENLTGAGPTVQKRSPCNCKKSRCLKLYCECFAAELFCDGCNCADCQNTPANSAVRDKAIKDTRAKNPNAFKPRFTIKGGSGMSASGASPAHSGHNMGCRCKRSECLKKYCECFQAGVMCGSKCKCVDCMNFAGSQKLIDKRRKIKDQRGAELAMKVAQDAWKAPQNSARKMPVARPAVHGMRPMPSPVATPSGRLQMAMPPHMMHPSPSGPHGPHPYMRPGYPPFMGYSPLGMPPHVSPSAYGMYPHHRPPPTPTHMPGQKPPTPTGSATKKPPMPAVKAEKTETTQPQPVAAKKATPPKTPAASGNSQQKVASAEKAKPPVAAAAAVKVEAKADNTPKTEKNDKKTPVVKVEDAPAAPKAAKVTPKSSQQPSLFDKVISGSQSSSTSPKMQPTPKDKPEVSSVQPTPAAETSATAPAKITPMPATPAPSVRLAYQSTDKRKGQMVEAPVFPYFGEDLPMLSEAVASNVFAFVADADVDKNAKLVCKRWNHLLATTRSK